jgi:hypothetical protein
MTQGAPKGNKFWLARATHGREKIFQTPAIMLKAACEYFEYQDNRQLMEIDFVGKDAREVEKPHKPPFTIQGLCIFLDVNSDYFTRFEQERKKENTEEAKEFCRVITHIKGIIYNQKFEGAATGFYNANIIARDLGLTDKRDLTTEGGPVSISVNVQDKGLQDKLNKE